MGILDNLENAWDALEQPNLATKIFSETVCQECNSQRESIHIPETDAMAEKSSG